MKNGRKPFFPPISAPTLLACALVISVIIIFIDPVRQFTFATFRFPFTAAKACVEILVKLPRLPSLTSENSSLNSKLIKQQLELERLREELRGNLQAKGLLALNQSADGVVASVIGRSVLPAQQTLLINRGLRSGVKLDAAVLSSSGVVGRVVESHSDSSLVVLLTDTDSRVSGIVERSRETGLLIGKSRGVCEFIYLDADADIQVGDRIVSAGLGGSFPKGLLLGTVTRIVKNEIAGSLAAHVKPAVRLGQLEEVLCILTADN